MLARAAPFHSSLLYGKGTRLKTTTGSPPGYSCACAVSGETNTIKIPLNEFRSDRNDGLPTPVSGGVDVSLVNGMVKLYRISMASYTQMRVCEKVKHDGEVATPHRGEKTTQPFSQEVQD